MSNRASWARWALILVSGTLVYNVIEAVVALWCGLEAESIALFGFGLDSAIETAAACVMLWRLMAETSGTDPEILEAREKFVRRFVGVTFIALAIYVLAQAGISLSLREAPEESLVGIILAIASLIIMPFLAWGKLRAAKEIESAALRAEAKETLACSYLSFTLLLGLGLHAWLGWWWADPVCALLMVPWLVKEGLEGVRAEDCCS